MRADTYSQAYYGSPRHNLIALLGDRQPMQVLEIGCGHGANLVEIKRRFQPCHTTGVELEPSVAEVARCRGDIDRVVQGDVLDARSVDFAPASFDLIVLSHVLEHFPEPGLVLQRCLGWLQSQGRVLIALPNLRHATVLLDLVLHGDFRYREDGILDQTHLRFFTRRSALRFLRAQGLEVLAVGADIEGPKSRRLDRYTFGLAKDFSAFAFNFLAIKAEATLSDQLPSRR